MILTRHGVFYCVQGEETQRQMNAALYLECSAKHRENVEDIFKEATKLALDHSRKSQQARKKRRKCHIMWNQQEKHNVL